MLKLTKLSATWCAPCKAFAKIFDNVKEMEEFSDITFEEYDIEDDDKGVELGEKFRVTALPCVLFTNENDELIYKLSGALPQSRFVELIKEKMQ